MAAERERKIRERAYHLWVEGGQQEGMDEHHWHEATRHVDSAPSAEKIGRKAAKAVGTETDKPKKVVKETVKAKDAKPKKVDGKDGKKGADKPPAAPKTRKASGATSGVGA